MAENRKTGKRDSSEVPIASVLACFPSRLSSLEVLGYQPLGECFGSSSELKVTWEISCDKVWAVGSGRSGQVDSPWLGGAGNRKVSDQGQRQRGAAIPSFDTARAHHTTQRRRHYSDRNPAYSEVRTSRAAIMDLNSLKDTVSNLTLYDLKAGVRKVQNGALSRRRRHSHRMPGPLTICALQRS
jgi:hypothetical protein